MDDRALISQVPSVEAPRLTAHQLGRWLLDGPDLEVGVVDAGFVEKAFVSEQREEVVFLQARITEDIR